MATKVRRRKLAPATVLVVGGLLAAPLVALLWVGSFAATKPRLWGFPFFYWYQLLWVLIAAAATAVAYFLVTRTGREIDVEDDDEEARK
jgi:membrane protein implicated in regulation of membrane protease activity